jgi:hypothetical protein
MLTVDETLEKLISNWPSLHRSRLTALASIFTGDCDDWSKGYPNADRTSGLYSRDEYETKEITLDASTAKNHYNTEMLYHLGNRAEKTFVRENAALIARTNLGEWNEFRYVPSFSEYQLNRIPVEKLTPEWRAALIELCKEILYLREDFVHRNPRGLNAESIERKVTDLKEAQKTAQECLIRLGEGDKEAEKARNAAIQKLRFEAEKYGFVLAKIETESEED